MNQSRSSDHRGGDHRRLALAVRFLELLVLFLLWWPASGLVDESGSIIAEGIGRDEQEARKNALQALSEQLVAAVDSTTTTAMSEKSTVTAVADDEQKKTSQSKFSFDETISVRSATLLKGVVYGKPEPKGDLVAVKAVLTGQAIKDTVTFLHSRISSKLDTLTPIELEETKTNCSFLQAVLTSAPLAVVPDKQELLAKSLTVLDEANRRLVSGTVTIGVKPEKAIILLDGKAVGALTPLLVIEGQHMLKVSLEGYHPSEGKFTLAKGERKTITVELIQALRSGLVVFLSLGAAGSVKDDIESTLSKYGFTGSQDPIASNALRVLVTDKTMVIDTYTQHDLDVYLEAFRGGTVFRKKKGSTKFTTQTENATVLSRKKLQEVTRGVVLALLREIDLEEFRSSNAVDYREVFSGTSVGTSPETKQ